MKSRSPKAIQVSQDVTVNNHVESSEEFPESNNYQSKYFESDEWLFSPTHIEKRQKIFESCWGGYALDPQLWEETNAPVIKIRDTADIELEELEYCGFFSDRLIGSGLSFLTRSPENRLYILSKCIMRKMCLTNITMLHFHRYLQYIDLAYNDLTNLTPLGGIPYLIFLDVSHNKLKDILNFKPPWYLTYVNLSYNYITEMCDLSNFWSIIRLDLSHNAIEVISGLQNLKYLQYLNLSYNLIEHIENLDNLNIQELNLEGNCLISFKSNHILHHSSGISTLYNLRTILLGYNRLSSLEFFKDSYGLRLIDLKFNKIADLLEVSHLKGLIHEIDFRGNPCIKWPNYRDVLLFSLPSIVFIDGAEVSITEKVSATTSFAPSIDLIAARSVTKLTLIEQLNIPKIDSYVAPYDQANPPLIILTGPCAVKKISLALHVSHILPDKIKYCRWHTTKELESENEHKSFIYVQREEFNEIARHGDFLAIQELLGHSYGLHMGELGSLSIEKKIGITPCDLHATMQIHSRYLNVKCILVFTKSIELHRKWIQEKFDIYTWIRDSIGNLLAVKVGKRTDSDSESTNSKVDFIEGIIDEVMEYLELPTYSMFVRPQGTGATATDIIVQSQTMLPKAIKTRSELELEEKKHITFQMESRINTQNLSHEEEQKFTELKIILDEKANIIIDDPEFKRRRQKARLKYRHSLLAKYKLNSFNIEEFEESVSSEEILLDLYTKKSDDMEKPEYLKDMYTEIVLKTRKIYAEQHERKPGFFSLVLMTDDYLKAFNSLMNFIYEVYVKQSFQNPSLSAEIQHYMKVVVPANTCSVIDEIREESISKSQQKMLLRTHYLKSWKDLMPSQTKY